ncbi:MAG: helix-turn-helix domain-containing protein [Fidelibacterota bacterium]
MFENWKEIKEFREKQGVSLQDLSAKMRLPVERIRFLEAGDFKDADPVIIRLQLKNYAQQLGIDYNEILRVSGLQKVRTPEPGAVKTEKVNIRKTHSYKGRKKEPSKTLIYGLIIVAVFFLIFFLNKLFENLENSEDLFEMTRKQSQALVNDSSYLHDSTLFKPVLPQAKKAVEPKDITENMRLLREFTIRFPSRVDLFPVQNISYRYEFNDNIPREEIISQDTPTSIRINRAGKIIFYNMDNTRFVFEERSFRDTGISRVVMEISESGQTKLFVK